MSQKVRQQERPIDWIREIIAHELGLDDDRVVIFNQRYELPTDNNLVISLVQQSSRPFGRTRTFTEKSSLGVGKLIETQTVSVQQTIVAVLLSRNQDAWLKAEFVAMAMTSGYAQKIQEAKSFKIGQLPAIENLSELEGGSMINRFDVTIPLLASLTTQKSVDYYDSFEVEVRANAGNEDTTAKFTQPLTAPK